MPNLIGGDASQISTNGMLGTLAFQDHKAVNIEGGKIGGVDVATIASTVLTGEELDSINSSANLVLRGGGVNLLTYSQDFDNAAGWSKSGSSIAANSTVAPDGSATADRLTEDTATAAHLTYQQTTITANTAHTVTVYAKSDARTRFKLYWANAANTTGANVDFDLSSGTASAISVYGTGAAYSATISSAGNGWYRCSLSGVIDASSTLGRMRIDILNAAGAFSYTGDGTSGIFIWGAQLVTGTAPGAYTKTVATAITTAAPALIDAPNGTATALPASVTPPRNGDMVIEATSNTTLTFKLRGTDGTVRSGTLTLV